MCDINVLHDEELTRYSKSSGIESDCSGASLMNVEEPNFCPKSSVDYSDCSDVIVLLDEELNCCSKSSDVEPDSSDGVSIDEEPNCQPEFLDDDSECSDVIVLQDEEVHSCSESSDVESDRFHDTLLDEKHNCRSKSSDEDSDCFDVLVLQDEKLSCCSVSSQVELNRFNDTVLDDEEPNCQTKSPANVTECHDVIVLNDEELNRSSESSDVGADHFHDTLFDKGTNCQSESPVDDSECSDVIVLDYEVLNCCSKSSDVKSDVSANNVLDDEKQNFSSKSSDDHSQSSDVLVLNDEELKQCLEWSDVESDRFEASLIDDEELNCQSRSPDNDSDCYDVIVLQDEELNSYSESSNFDSDCSGDSSLDEEEPNCQSKYSPKFPDGDSDSSDVVVLDDAESNLHSKSPEVEPESFDETSIDDKKLNCSSDSSDVETSHSDTLCNAVDKHNCSSASTEDDAAQEQIISLLQSLLYKCRLYGKFFEKRREQRCTRIAQCEQRKRKRFEGLQERKAVLIETSALTMAKSALDHEKPNETNGWHVIEAHRSTFNGASSMVISCAESPKYAKRDITVDFEAGCGCLSTVSDELSAFVDQKSLIRTECWMDCEVEPNIPDTCGENTNESCPTLLEHAVASSFGSTPEKINSFTNSHNVVKCHTGTHSRNGGSTDHAGNHLRCVKTEDPTEFIVDYIEGLLSNIADQVAFKENALNCHESSTSVAQDVIVVVQSNFGDDASSPPETAIIPAVYQRSTDELYGGDCLVRTSESTVQVSPIDQHNGGEMEDFIKCTRDSLVVQSNSCADVAVLSKPEDFSSVNHMGRFECVRLSSPAVGENAKTSSILLTPEEVSSTREISKKVEHEEIRSLAVSSETSRSPTICMEAGELSSCSLSVSKNKFKVKNSPVLRSPDQPVLLSGGILRQYQLDGVNWLTLMYECGFSGILADEMGLGKTIQCISLICHLIAQRVCGPFLICAPLSAIATWVNELKQFAPKVPVVVYHGDQQERIKHRSKLYGKPKKIHRWFYACPVILTTYDLVILDRQYLSKADWRLIVVDEGHRIRNLHCRLMRELSLYKAPVKLLITGTPMQNGVDDLCSLLVFLVPELSADILSLQNCLKKWINAQMLEDSTFENSMKQKKFERFLSTMHQILTPFMLRRLKSDVALTIPPKKELLVSTSLSVVQQEIYEALFIRAMELKSIKHEPNTLVCDEAERLHDPGNAAVCDEKKQGECRGVGVAEPERRALRKRKYNGVSEKDCVKNETNESAQLVYGSSDEKMKKVKIESVNMGDTSDQSNSSERKPASLPDGLPVGAQLNNLLLELRRCCNHPQLVGDLSDIEMNESVVSNSGKLGILDRLLIELKKNSHKVLVFCQLIDMLDILESYCEMRQFSHCRIDGSTPLTDRASSIERFNRDENVFVFLLTTRSGGVGINLTAADTVVIYESDWNPQWDTQAQDRCHRIGQTKPVVVYRLLARNTIDEKMFLRAKAKTRLEKLVIHKDKFKSGLDDGTAVTTEELLALLRDSQVHDDDMNARSSNEIDLRHLLDRADLYEKWTGTGL